MKYKVCLHQSEEGFDVWVPGLPGCCSQGDTEEEALACIADAIQEYLEAIAEPMAELLVNGKTGGGMRQPPGIAFIPACS